MPSILSRIRDALSFKAAEPAPISARSVPYMRFLSTIGREIHPRDAWGLYKSVGVLAKTIDLIADNVANLKPIVSIDGEIYEEHEILELLDRPGYSRTRRGLIKELAIQYLVTGTACPHMIGNTNYLPAVIDIFKTADLSIIEDNDGFPRSLFVAEPRRTFLFERQQGRDLTYLSGSFSQVVPIYDQQGDTRGMGLSRIQAIRDEIELKLTGTIHNRSMMDQGARPSGMLSFKGRLSDDQLARVQSDIVSSSGPQGAGKVLVSDGGDIDFKPFMMTMRDMDWTNLIKVVDQSITDRFSVPITLFTADAQTYNNYTEAWRALYDQAVLPCFNVIYAGLAQAFSARLGVKVELIHDAMSNQILADQAADRSIKLLVAQIITVNEAREMIGMEPIAGGDEIFAPPGLVPQYQDLFDSDGNLLDASGPGKTGDKAPPGATIN
jgi:HK97 family phage portal protein